MLHLLLLSVQAQSGGNRWSGMTIQTLKMFFASTPLWRIRVMMLKRKIKGLVGKKDSAKERRKGMMEGRG
ncbi:hypothetical protein V6Z11_D05G391600 [Gossypium hirsutum]